MTIHELIERAGRCGEMTEAGAIIEDCQRFMESGAPGATVAEVVRMASAVTALADRLAAGEFGRVEGYRRQAARELLAEAPDGRTQDKITQAMVDIDRRIRAARGEDAVIQEQLRERLERLLDLRDRLTGDADDESPDECPDE